MGRICLNGIWQHRIGTGPFTAKKVPYSDPCTGWSQCQLQFDRHENSERVFLVLEGITYRADVTLNGQVVATDLAPYIPHTLEVTSQIKDRENLLVVDIRDTQLAFGPACGWQNYGGIIRDVYLDYCCDSVIRDLVWHYELSENFDSARCYVEPEIDGSGELICQVMLQNAKGIVVAEREGCADEKISFSLEQPELWSPDEPNLYTLTTTLIRNGKILDRNVQKVGFKELKIQGRRFTLNGKPFLILGVNRHDQYGDCGHTLTEDQLRQDLSMIKKTGCNYIRLVHYPHCRRVVELADEMGLLVSEEPGLWWSDMHDPDTCAGALEALAGIIRRDRNRTSIAWWLSFNECVFTLDFLKDSARVARENDPYHMVSGANCMSLEMTKENFPVCGFDFYTMHPYGPTTQRIRESADILSEMPLIFTEWGGYYTSNNPRNLRDFIRCIVKLMKAPENEPCLAGAVYWEWADMNEFHRGYPACKDGVLYEGLVDKYRNPTPDLAIFTEEFARLYQEDKKFWQMNLMPFAECSGNFCCASLPDQPETVFTQAVKDATFSVDNHLVRTKPPRMTHGPRLDQIPAKVGGMPAVMRNVPLVAEGELAIPLNRAASRIHVFGNTGLLRGWPTWGRYGEEFARYTVEYTDGTRDEHILKNGQDITTCSMLFASSRLNPVAADCPRVAEFVHDLDWEQYVINMKTLQTDSGKIIAALRVQTGNPLLIYGLTVES